MGSLPVFHAAHPAEQRKYLCQEEVALDHFDQQNSCWDCLTLPMVLGLAFLSVCSASHARFHGRALPTLPLDNNSITSTKHIHFPGDKPARVFATADDEYS